MGGYVFPPPESEPEKEEEEPAPSGTAAVPDPELEPEAVDPPTESTPSTRRSERIAELQRKKQELEAELASLND